MSEDAVTQEGSLVSGEEEEMEEGEVAEEEEFLPGYNALHDYSKVLTKVFFKFAYKSQCGCVPYTMYMYIACNVNEEELLRNCYICCGKKQCSCKPVPFPLSRLCWVK